MLAAKDSELAKAIAAVESLRSERSRSSSDANLKQVELASMQSENARLRQLVDEKSLEIARLRSTVDQMKSDTRRLSSV